jgi:hypothetical protein
MTDVAKRVDAIDWQAARADLDAQGWAMLLGGFALRACRHC